MERRETLRRNIAFFAQGGVGKTTLLDGILLSTKSIPQGAAEAASIRYEPEEQEHQVAITSHFGHFDWHGADITFIDAPGALSYLESNKAILPAVEGAVFVVSATESLKAESVRLWRMLDDSGIPVIVFVNKMDDPGADYAASVRVLSSRLSGCFVPYTIPVVSHHQFAGIVSALDLPETLTEDEIPESFRGDFRSIQETLREAIIETDDALMERYIEGGPIEDSSLRTAFRSAVASRKIFPVMCGSAGCRKGFDALLDAVVELFPAPQERESLRPFTISDRESGAEAICKTDKDSPFRAMIIKTIIDPFSGRLSVVRVVSGQVASGDSIYNSTHHKKYRLSHLYRMQGKELQPVDSLGAGEIGAIAKLEDSHTGNTLGALEDDCVFGEIVYAEPTVFYAVEADDPKQTEKMAVGLARLADEDPTLHVSRDAETHELILSGMGRTHLDIALERLTRKYRSQAHLKSPRIPFRETIRGPIKVQGKLKKQSGGHGQFAVCWLEVEPLPRGAGFEFEDRIVGGVIPRQYIPSIQKGVRSAMVKGLLGGNPVTDIKVSVYDGQFHDVDSSDYAFQIAGSLALKAALEQAGSVLLEPIASVRIELPERCMGDVLRDIAGRRGKVINLSQAPGTQVIEAEIPMAEMLDYGNELTTVTAGEGDYAMHISYYREVSDALQARYLEGAAAS